MFWYPVISLTNSGSHSAACLSKSENEEDVQNHVTFEATPTNAIVPTRGEMGLGVAYKTYKKARWSTVEQGSKEPAIDRSENRPGSILSQDHNKRTSDSGSLR